MFKNRKLELKLVKDDATEPETPLPTSDIIVDYAEVIEEFASRIGKKLVIGIVVTAGSIILAKAVAEIAVNACAPTD